MNQIPVARRTEPSVPVTDSRFTYSRGADVQSTWRRFGWVPPSEVRQPIVEERMGGDWLFEMENVE